LGNPSEDNGLETEGKGEEEMTLTVEGIVSLLTLAGLIITVITFVSKMNKTVRDSGIQEGILQKTLETYKLQIDAAHAKIRELDCAGDQRQRMIEKMETNIDYIVKSIDDIKKLLNGKFSSLV
jgi:competence protein ComGC